MDLYVFRHGPSEDPDPRRWPDDSGRPLSEVGAEETRRAAKGFSGLVGAVGRIATSPMVRARVTAEILASSWKVAPRVDVWEELSTGAPAAPILARVGRRARSSAGLVLVGHEPTLAEFVGLALTGEAVPVCRIARAGAASLEFPERVAPGGARLAWLLTRKQLMERAR